MKPDCVFFDVDDTLLDFSACAAEAISKSFGALGTPEPEGLREAFFRINPVLWSRIENGSLDHAGLKRIRWNTIFSEVGFNGDGERFEKLFEDALFETHVPVDGALRLLEGLHGRVRLCAASNASDADRQTRRLRNAGMEGFFEKIFVSARIGFSKPKREFFSACFSQLPGVSPEKSVFVGDSPKADIAGAKDFGMRTLLFDPRGRYPDCGADLRARTLGEAGAALEREFFAV